ncbi:FMN-binding negative transcriptional regulator [Cellulomonas dongxiuzhuiae]|uniref:FMN-binding negative transcriptional regulator n=1 Tax=Cellulomonas dongxiuzhuiae TaxID=2819979 RepID=A0ABX8GJT7_9CELL|nr:FMN-binding negative transcriptional regulator [Cellulomonas dongxiuzhuiae]MBO3095356.1 FMN-binding negative transcriptional regulator [Cellulomonas dongxiuzhuiae]QWC16344.1 FMN-binding negative transcriptional regulator [Cellulomonas dongxiuzhuiae]
MYIPVFNALADADEIRALVASVGTAELVTVGTDGYPTSTLLPVVWDGDRLVLHMARANPQWRTIGDDAPALAVVTGPQAYVSPTWYPSKAEHGRTVPTWNYSAVHLTGRARVRTDASWLHEAVTLLTDHHESGRADRWQVTDAPAAFVEKQLRAVVGIEVLVERVEAKAKLSQNRSAADHAGVVTGLDAQDDAQASAVAHAMRTHGTRAPRACPS